MKKKIFVMLMAGTMAVSSVGCGGAADNSSEEKTTGEASGEASAGETAQESGGESAQSESTGPINLTLWGAEEDQDFLKERVEAFKEEYPDQEFNIEIGTESESTAKDTVLTDIEAAADVFAFADDQLADLVDAGALLPINSDMDQVLQNYANKSVEDIKAANVAVSIDDATKDGELYAFPTSADNGYFLYYDSDIFTEDDVKSWDSLLKAAEEKGGGKKVGMTLASGWYNSGFYYGAGFTTDRNEDGTTACDWNKEANGVSGVDVTRAVMKIAGDKNFMAITDGDISNQIASGKLCAVVSGTWDSQNVEKVFGGFAATTLPKFTAGDKEIQMGSVGGAKLMGVNSHCEYAGWGVLLAEYLTNEESQTIHFEERQIGPSNLNAQNSDEVKNDIAISAVLEQSQYAVIQKVGGKFWDPSKTFGEKIAQGKIKDDDASIQKALDELVEGISAPVE